MTTALCPHCKTPQSWPPEATSGRCPACQALVFRPVVGPRVLLVNGDDVVSEELGLMLERARMHALRVTNSVDTLRIFSEQPIAALVVDAALENGSAFELLDSVRAQPNGGNVKIVLVAPIHNAAAYKRPPKKLYGADEYIELHHASQMLVPKLLDMLQPQGSHFSGRVRVHALAHSIVADIALYHQAAFEAAVHKNDVLQLQQALDEGRRLLAEMVNPTDFDSIDPVGDVFTAFVDEMRRVNQ